MTIQAVCVFQGLCSSRLRCLDISFNQLSSVDSNLLASALVNIEQVSKNIETAFKKTAFKDVIINFNSYHPPLLTFT